MIRICRYQSWSPLPFCGNMSSHAAHVHGRDLADKGVPQRTVRQISSIASATSIVCFCWWSVDSYSESWMTTTLVFAKHQLLTIIDYDHHEPSWRPGNSLSWTILIITFHLSWTAAGNFPEMLQTHHRHSILAGHAWNIGQPRFSPWTASENKWNICEERDHNRGTNGEVSGELSG